jgi:hypothetical protein
MKLFPSKPSILTLIRNPIARAAVMTKRVNKEEITMRETILTLSGSTLIAASTIQMKGHACSFRFEG